MFDFYSIKTFQGLATNLTKGIFFEITELPNECPQCKHPRVSSGFYMVCLFCHQRQAAKFIVLGKELNLDDHLDFMEASDAILAHITHQTDITKVVSIMREAFYVQSYALNIIGSKADAAKQYAIKYIPKIEAICKALNLKDEDFDNK